MKFLKQKEGFLGYEANTKIKSKVVVVPFGLEKTVSYGAKAQKMHQKRLLKPLIKLNYLTKNLIKKLLEILELKL